MRLTPYFRNGGGAVLGFPEGKEERTHEDIETAASWCWALRAFRRPCARRRGAALRAYRGDQAPLWGFAPRPIQVDQSVVIERPLEEVFAFLADPENDAQWTPMVTETRKSSEGPLGVGTRYEQSGHFLGRNFAMLFEVTEYEPNRKIGQRLISQGQLVATGSSSVEAVSGGTQVTLTGEAQAGGFFWLLPDRIIAFPAQRIMGVALRNLKELLETRS